MADQFDYEHQVAQAGQLDTETMLRRLRDMIGGARPMPLSASVMINRDEVLEMLEDAMARIPEEFREARWLLKEREEFLAAAQREADDILESGRARAERMVARTEVVKASEHRARRIVEHAESEARRMQREAEDFCDQKLASFEIVLERTMQVVQAGRERLQTQPTTSPVDLDDHGEGFIAGTDDGPAAARTSDLSAPDDGSNPFFDQDSA